MIVWNSFHRSKYSRTTNYHQLGISYWFLLPAAVAPTVIGVALCLLIKWGGCPLILSARNQLLSWPASSRQPQSLAPSRSTQLCLWSFCNFYGFSAAIRHHLNNPLIWWWWCLIIKEIFLVTFMDACDDLVQIHIVILQTFYTPTPCK